MFASQYIGGYIAITLIMVTLTVLLVVAACEDGWGLLLLALPLWVIVAIMWFGSFE